MTGLPKSRIYHLLAGHLKEHVKRNIKQLIKLSETSQVINTGTGIDPATKVPIKIFEDDIVLDTFEDIIIELSKKCHIRGYSINTVEDIVCIGAYDITKFPSDIFNFWIKSVGITSKIFDLRQSFSSPCTFPIFLHAFSENFLIDLINGQKVIKMAININKWLDCFKDNGCSVRFMSKKETIKKSSTIKGGSNILFLIDGCGIEIKKNEISYMIGQGLIERILFDFKTPSSILQSMLNMFDSPME